MHVVLHSTLVFLATIGWAVADLPVKAPLSKYAPLWTNSPFTSKPPPKAPEALPKVFEDYALAGVSPVSDGYRVTLLNKKQPDERIVVEPGKTNKEGFKVVAVTRKRGDPLATEVRMTAGTQSGIITFDEKLLTLAAATPPPATRPPANAVITPAQPRIQPGQAPPRQPRPRVVPPPANAVQPQPGQINRNRPARR